MIAPTNCNPHCDCAQRMVRCQKASAKSPAELDFVEKHIAAPTKEELIRQAEDRGAIAEAVEEAAAYMAAHPDVFVPFFETSSQPPIPLAGTELLPPPYVIPASLASGALEETFEKRKTFLDDLEELEKEFPADMGIAPLPEDSIVQQREFTPEENAAFDAADAKMKFDPANARIVERCIDASDIVQKVRAEQHCEELQRCEIVELAPGVNAVAQYPGASGPWMLVGYDRTILRQRLIKAFQDSPFDLADWDYDTLGELADIAIVTLEKKTP